MSFLLDISFAILILSNDSLFFEASGAAMGEFTGLYYVTFKEYIAFYRIHGDVIEVARVLFSRSDYMKVLFGKSEYFPEDDED